MAKATPKKADFLVEVGTEELPPKALRKLETAFCAKLLDGIEAAGLTAGEHEAYSTPRRLAVLVRDLDLRQPVQQIEKRGPPVSAAFGGDGTPTRAALAFAKGCGVGVDDLTRMKTDKGEWLLFSADEPGHKTAELLPGIVATALDELPIPKRMRWGSSDAEFVRPVHWLVMLLGKHVVKCEILETAAGAETRGHRFHAPDPIRVKPPADYERLLKESGHVIASFEQRRERIHALTEAAAAKLNCVVMLDPDILDEVTALVEWPMPVIGEFSPDYLRLPEEVLVATLQSHQRYFPMRDANGRPMPNFIAISNLDSLEPEQVRLGNERVVAPRLADAAFFWDRDSQSTLESRRDELKGVVFQKSLGSLHDKSSRVGALAAGMADAFDADPDFARRASELAKTDLLTLMVGEFPELEGCMGYYYATNDGEAEEVAAAIREQYRPRHAGDALPETRTGQLLAVADRLDTLAGIFAIGKRPTGNKDPFGLRRAALGVARILIETGTELDLFAHLGQAFELQPVKPGNPAELVEEAYDFIVERTKAWFLDGMAPGLEKGAVTPEIFESVRARRPTSPLDFHQRLAAVCRFMQLDAAESLAIANKRIANILRSADEDKTGEIDPGLFDAAEEKALHEAVATIADSHRQGLDSRDYGAVLEGLAALKEPVDAYFDGVLVMDEDSDKRRNRLGTLSRLRQLFLDVADIGRIPRT